MHKAPGAIVRGLFNSGVVALAAPALQLGFSHPDAASLDVQERVPVEQREAVIHQRRRAIRIAQLLARR